eukprot:591270-Pyramimonas_sp.AAC.1
MAPGCPPLGAQRPHCLALHPLDHDPVERERVAPQPLRRLEERHVLQTVVLRGDGEQDAVEHLARRHRHVWVPQAFQRLAEEESQPMAPASATRPAPICPRALSRMCRESALDANGRGAGVDCGRPPVLLPPAGAHG